MAGWLQVACKTILKDRTQAIKSIMEVKVLIRLSHPNINSIIDVVDEEYSLTGDLVGRLHLILELMPGGDLFSYHEKHGKLPEFEVKWIAFQLVEGLRYLHEKDIAHRGRSLAVSNLSQ